MNGGDGADDGRSDEDLLEGYFRGEAPAFDAFFRRHAPRVLAYSRKRGLDAQAAADVAQEVFLKLHKSIDRYEHGRAALPWFFTIVHRACLDRLRAGKREERFVWTECPELAALPTAEAAHAVEELPDEVEAALAALPDEQRRVIRWRLEREGSFEELARESSRSETSLRKSYSRGLAGLRRALGRWSRG